MRSLRRPAWWYLVAFSVLIGLFGIGDVLGGIAVDPGITAGLSGLTLDELATESAVGYGLFDFASRAQGLALILVGLLLSIILVVPYRAGMRWAWFVMWSLPAWSFAVLALYVAHGVHPGQPPPPPMVSGPLLGAMAILALLMERTRFATTTVKAERPAPEEM